MSVTAESLSSAAEFCRPDRLDAMLHCWLAHRTGTVAAKTLRTDQDLLRLIPPAYLSRDPHTITAADVETILTRLRGRGLSELSVRRHRASLSQLFGWLVRIGVLEASPVLPAAEAATPVGGEVRPFSAAELDAAFFEWRGHDRRLADIMLVLARTGLRWSEARVVQVADVELSSSRLIVAKAASEGTLTRCLPAGQIRHVPVVDQLQPIITRLVAGRPSDELLFTTCRGSQLHRTAVLRRLDWQRTGHGRRLHDLRHTAAHLWLTEGVEASTVQTWMGHTLLALGA